jgi:hypothetical protein
MPEENTNTPVVEKETTEEPKKLSYEEMEAELRKVRQEAASRRITNRELEDQAKKWQEYEESQKTELQKLQEALAERDKKLSAYQLERVKVDVVKEYGLDIEDAELLTGSDEATIRKQAEKLKTRLGSRQTENNRPVDLLAGNRGTPIGSNGSGNFDDFIRKLARGQ